MTAQDKNPNQGQNTASAKAASRGIMDFLLALARNPSQQARARLADEISGLCRDDRPLLTDQERDLISAILKKLLDEFELPLRQQLGERLAKIQNVPADLIVALANDQIEVARPILLHSQMLLDGELMDIITHRGRQHQLAIARRRDLSETVSDGLVDTQDEDVITALLRNQGARISETTMAYLVDQSQRVDSFQEPLVRRSDLSDVLAKRLYWWVAASLRETLLSSYDIDPTDLDDAIEDSAEEVAPVLVEKSQELTSAAELARQIAEQEPISADTIIKVLRQGEIALFEALLGEACALPSPQLQRVVYAPKGDGITVLCRALRFPKQSFATIFMLSRGSGQVLNPKDLARATKLFDSLSHEKAQTIVVRWRRDTEYQEALSSMATPLPDRKSG
ncbi:MAG: DUF2336 domain-containing protein [Pseudomonadota bacterium]